FDVIVIGSGIGGLSCAAALAQLKRKILVLEQHNIAGGLTQTFSRDGYTWDVGVHYLGQMGPGEQAKRVLDWLSGRAIKMASMGAIYDTIRFPENFELSFSRPAHALKLDLKEAFPESSYEIDRFFAILTEAAKSAEVPFMLRAMPRKVGSAVAFWKRKSIAKWWARTTEQVLSEIISDKKLRAVLSAQWGDYGGKPCEASFGLHALIINHYLGGAYYPVGGAQVFANTLIPQIEAAGGAVRVNSPVASILVEAGNAVGVCLEDGSEYRASRVVSDIGARNTVNCLLRDNLRVTSWASDVMALKPSICHVALYLGFEGDIHAAGATRSNVWIYETWDPNSAIWQDPFAEPTAPMLFVSFPSLKDPAHGGGHNAKHTGEVIAWVNWEAFSQWADSSYGARPEEYRLFKDVVVQNILAQFKRHFPALSPMIRYHELSTPLSTLHFTRAVQGAIYGLETTPRRFLSRCLDIRTPIPGLYLAGQDPITPGVTGAMMGGVLAAAAIDSRVFLKIR
ncbi:MAG TPA: NAD(P)/FAD-dependent oxidoreductase, partial [Burkholderiales bacterium]|nr:NAD(P)/FAD-dependent oxidoreductase [Burkholderiales bacterium]